MGEFGVLAAVTAVFITIAYYAADYGCRSKWPEVMKPEYSFITGCTIETKEGRMPSENYRVL